MDDDVNQDTANGFEAGADASTAQNNETVANSSEGDDLDQILNKAFSEAAEESEEEAEEQKAENEAEANEEDNEDSHKSRGEERKEQLQREIRDSTVSRAAAAFGRGIGQLHHVAR